MKNSSVSMLCLLVASAAAAEPPPSPRVDAASVVALVKERVVQRLEKAEKWRNPFSRAEPPPKARRVRVIGDETTTDAAGRRFVRFAVDELHPDDDGNSDRWYYDVYTGCAYVDRKSVFLQQGTSYVPASTLVGADVEPAPVVCVPASDSQA